MSTVIETSDFVSEAAEWIAGRIIAGQKEEERDYRLSLCGGSTPAPVFEKLAVHPEIDWSRMIITFGDERCVPPDYPDSNFRMAKKSLLDPAGLSGRNVLRMKGEMDPGEAAWHYEGRLRALAADADEEIFTHDLILLGMGEDGHTASLFPHSAALSENERWVAKNFVPKLEAWRLTLTFPLINAARCAAFLVTGAAKRAIVEQILRNEGEHPAGRVAAEEVVWMLG